MGSVIVSFDDTSFLTPCVSKEKRTFLWHFSRFFVPLQRNKQNKDMKRLMATPTNHHVLVFKSCMTFLCCGLQSCSKMPCFNLWISNYFFIPPKFAFSLKLNFLIFPLIAFYLRVFCVNLLKLLVRYSLFS